MKSCHTLRNKSLEWASSFKNVLLYYEYDGRAALENIIQFSGYHELLLTFQWLAFAFLRKALNYLALLLITTQLKKKCFYGISMYSLVSRLKMTLFPIIHAQSQSQYKRLILLRSITCLPHCYADPIYVTCNYSSVLAELSPSWFFFCLCQYLFVFGGDT